MPAIVLIEEQHAVAGVLGDAEELEKALHQLTSESLALYVPALILIGMNVAPEHEHEFNEWYNTEHIPALGSVPGTLCARRYRGTGGTQRYVALYHLNSPDILKSAEWKKAADTPWTQKMRPHFRDMLRLECRRYTRAE